MTKGTAIGAGVVFAAAVVGLVVMPEKVKAGVTGVVGRSGPIEFSGSTTIASGNAVGGASTTAPNGKGVAGATSNAVKAFDLSGSLASGTGATPTSSVALYPGAQLLLHVVVTNPYNFPIRVTSISATPAKFPTNPDGSLATACPTVDGAGAPTNIGVTSAPNLALTVPANGSAAQDLPVTMFRSAANECQRVNFRVVLSSQAVKA